MNPITFGQITNAELNQAFYESPESPLNEPLSLHPVHEDLNQAFTLPPPINESIIIPVIDQLPQVSTKTRFQQNFHSHPIKLLNA